MATIGKATKLSVATLAIMNVTAVVSLRGLPAEAEYGVSSAFYYLFAANRECIPRGDTFILVHAVRHSTQINQTKQGT
jgi:hypothetical protein